MKWLTESLICTYLKIENYVILSIVISEIVNLVNFTKSIKMY